MGTNRILIVDDMKDLRRQVIESISLVYNNYSFLEADNGKEALTKFVRYKPDLILLDIDMPQMNGIEVLERIRKSRNEKLKKVPIIMFTGNNNPTIIKKILNLGVEGSLVKPYEIEVLMEKVEQYLTV